MKKWFLFLIFGLFCSGCTPDTQPACRVVTGVEVQYTQHENVLQRTYSTPDSIQHMLNYLRLLDPHGPGLRESPLEESCRITLHYSHGPDCTYYQAGNAYLRRDTGHWKDIDAAQAQLLYPMLLLLPSDG